MINSAKVAYVVLIRRQVGRLNVGRSCVIWVAKASQHSAPFSITWDRRHKMLDILLPIGKEDDE
jgi:hypothetical protein